MSETRITNNALDFNPNIPNYNLEFVPTLLSTGGVGMYIDETVKYTVIERTSNEAFQSLWIELQFTKQSDIICGVIYGQRNSAERFLDYFEEAVDRYSATGKPICLFGDININILRVPTCLPMLMTIFLQTSSPITMPVGTLLLVSLIIFPNFASFDHPLIQLSPVSYTHLTLPTKRIV